MEEATRGRRWDPLDVPRDLEGDLGPAGLLEDMRPSREAGTRAREDSIVVLVDGGMQGGRDEVILARIACNG